MRRARSMLTFSRYSLPVLSFLAVVTSYENRKEPCFESWIINEEAFVPELSNYADCIISITTSENQVLAFHYVEGAISDLIGSVKIRDGISASAPLVTFENQPVKESITRVNHDKTVYTTGPSALVHITKNITSGKHLKIQKAVDCPFNIGTNSQCSRIFDEVSCYCATFVRRSWGDQVVYCSDKGMKLVSLESPEEEEAIYAFWGRETPFWTSLNDIGSEGLWIWSSTEKHLNPGYSNWEFGEPNGETCAMSIVEDCMVLNWKLPASRWYDDNCGNMYQAICENGP